MYLQYRLAACESPIIAEIDLYNIMSSIMNNIIPQKKKIVCYFKSLEGLDLTNTLFHQDGYKYYLPARIDISYDIDFIAKINLMIQSKED